MGMPLMVATVMVMKIAPLTLFIMSMPARMRHKAKSCFSGSVTKLASDTIDVLEVARPALLSPREAKKNPTPTPMALRSDMGIHSMMSVRQLEKDRIVNITPSMKMAVRAKCHE